MLFKQILILLILFVPGSKLFAQQFRKTEISYLKKENELVPGEIFNIAFFVANTGEDSQKLNARIIPPEGWKAIIKNQAFSLNPSEKKLLVYSLQIPLEYPVGEQQITLAVTNTETGDTTGTESVPVEVKEIESIALMLVESPDYVIAGETFKAHLLLQNLGNTTKQIYIETQNCDIEGTSELTVEPGKSVEISVFNNTAPETKEATKVYFSVRAGLKGQISKSIYQSYTVFPTSETRKDLFFRFPVTASANFLASNQREHVESIWQFELHGKGMLDPAGNHQLEFLARGPGNTNLSYLGLYDQYFISYSNKNLDLFAGEKSYSFTPLTESARFGLGTENKIRFNNGLSFGFVYVKPRYFGEIEDELAGYSGFEINDDNKFGFLYVSKKYTTSEQTAQLASITAQLMPLKKTNIDFEFSRGIFQNIADNAFHTNVNSQFSVFYLAANYFYTGKNYPGYFSNSTFYSGSFSANLSPKINVGFYAKEDFRNAALDTFFVNAPYSKSFQSFINYNLASRSFLKLYWRDYERKDRLVLDKFHYKTRSVNAQFNQKIRKLEYSLLGEYGQTTNFLLSETENRQETYRATTNIAWRFNSSHYVRFFGSWSNVNSFISDDQQNLIAGISATSRFSKNLIANIYLQNAYNIDDYFRNRNLMQLNLDYSFLNKHKLSLRGFYTLFRQKIDNPEFSVSVNYSYKFGIPLKQVIKAGDLHGRIIRENDEPAEGIVVSLQNKTAITDKNGEFWLNTIEPGRHLLFVNREKFDLNEITNIQLPMEIEIIEDQEIQLNIKITKGAKITGTFKIKESEFPALRNENVTCSGIVVELKNDFEQFRTATGTNSRFSFPVVRPGKWIIKIYTNSLPAGFEIKNPVIELDLKPGEEQNLLIELQQKKRNIIFKSGESLMLQTKPIQENQDKISESKAKKAADLDSVYYSVQLGAFTRKLPGDSPFFKNEQFVFEIENNNFHKYFAGKYATYEEAKNEWERLRAKFKNIFVVLIKNNIPVHVNQE